MEELTVSAMVVTLLATWLLAPLTGIVLSVSIKDTDKEGKTIPLSTRRWKIFLAGSLLAVLLYFVLPLVFTSTPQWISAVFGVGIGNLFIAFAGSTLVAAMIWEGPSSRDFLFLMKKMMVPVLLSVIAVLFGITKHYSFVDQVNAAWAQLDVVAFQQEQATRQADPDVARWMHGDGAVSPVMVIIASTEAEARRMAGDELEVSSQKRAVAWLAAGVLIFGLFLVYVFVIKPKKNLSEPFKKPKPQPEPALVQGWDSPSVQTPAAKPQSNKSDSAPVLEVQKGGQQEAAQPGSSVPSADKASQAESGGVQKGGEKKKSGRGVGFKNPLVRKGKKSQSG